MLRLRDIMSTEVVTVGPTTTLREAAELLATRHIGGAPVVDGSSLVGVVSASDILALAAAATATRAEPDEPPEYEADDDTSAWSGGDDPSARHFTKAPADLERDVVDWMDGPTPGADVLDGHTVADVMTRELVTLPPTADVVSAAGVLRRAEVHRVLVVDRGKLLGIVTTTDIARAVAERRLVRHTFVFDTARPGRGVDEESF